MATIAEARKMYPSLDGLDDNQAVDALHQALYSDLPREQVANALGVKPPEKPAEARGIGGYLKDAGVALARGAVGLPEAFVGLGDLATGGRVGKALAEGIDIPGTDGQRLRYDPKATKDFVSDFNTPQQKAANEEVNKADGFFPTVAAMARNPSTIVNQAIESSPSMLGGAWVARGAMKAGLSAAERLAISQLPKAEQAAAIAAASRVGPIAAGAIGEGATAAGQNAEQVRQEDPNGTLTPEQSAILAASGVLTGGISLGAGKLANKLGIGDVQTMLARGKVGVVGEEAAEAAAKKGLIRKTAEGFASEGVLQELPQSYQEQVAQNIAQGKPWDQGAASAGAQGMMAGGLMGSGGNVVSHFGENNEKPVVSDPIAEAKAQRDAELAPLAQRAAENPGNSTLTRAALAGSTGAAADAELATQVTQNAQQATLVEPDPKLQAKEKEAADHADLNARTDDIVSQAKGGTIFAALRAEESPVSVKEFVSDLSIAQSKAARPDIREKALGRMQIALDWAGQNKAAETPSQLEQIVGEQTSGVARSSATTPEQRRAGADRDMQLRQQLKDATTDFDRMQIQSQIELNNEMRFGAPEKESTSAAPAAAGITPDEQTRLDAAAADGNKPTASNKSPAADAALKRIADRKGVASPEDAAILKEAGYGSPYDSVNLSLSSPAATGGKPRSTTKLEGGTDKEALAERERERESDNAQGSAKIGQRAAAPEAPETRNPPPPAPADVERLLSIKPFQRTAADKIALTTAKAAYTPEQMALLDKSANNAPFTLSTAEKLSLRTMQEAHDNSIKQSTGRESEEAPAATESATQEPANFAAPNVPAIAGAGPAVFRKRRATLTAVAESGLSTVERRHDGSFYMVDGTRKRQYKLSGPADAALARKALQDLQAKFDTDAHAAASSPLNKLADPTQAQKDAGNYAKGHGNWFGVGITVETPKGATRSGLRPDGTKWSHVMSDHYGYAKRTVGADGEQVDTYIGGVHPTAFVIDQVDQETGKFDEHKAMLGYANKEAAIKAYSSNFDAGWKVGPVTDMSVDGFKDWLKKGDTTKPAGGTNGATRQNPNEDTAQGSEAGRDDAGGGVDAGQPGREVRDAGADDRGAGVAGASAATAQSNAVAGTSPGHVTVNVGGKPVTINLVKKAGAEASLLRNVADLFGKKIAFFSNPEIGDGFVAPGHPDTIFLKSQGSSINPMAVFGHELLHLLKKEMPEIHAAMEQAVLARLPADQRAAYRRDYNGKAEAGTSWANTPLLSDEIEELTSDVGGNLMSDPGFWKEVFSQVEKDSPGASKGLVAQLASRLYALLDQLLAVINKSPYKATQMITDIEGARFAFKSGLAEYVKAKGISRASMQGEILKAGQEAKLSKTRDQKIYWHGSPSGDLRGGSTGLHLGTNLAATQALEARIGVPAAGEWDGTREYGKTLLAGSETLARLQTERGHYLGTGANSQVARKDYYPKAGSLKYADGTEMPMSVKPSVRPFQLDTPMTNSRANPHEDFKANGYMAASKKKGNAKSGYYYTNIGEDTGSISVVVPNGSHVKPADIGEAWNPDITKSPVRDNAKDDQGPTRTTDVSGRDNTSGRLGQASDAGNGKSGGTPSHGSPRAGAVSALGRHYSTGVRRALSGSAFGRGLKGAERTRLEESSDQRLKSRVNFYIDLGKGITPEAGVGSYAHEVKLNNLYDSSTKTLKYTGGANEFESAVLDAGYDGYMVRNNTTKQGAAVLLGKAAHSIPVQAIGQPKNAPLAEDQEPANRKKSLTGKELDAVNVDAIPGAALKNGNLVVPAGQYDAANVELARIGSPVRFSLARAADGPAAEYAKVEAKYKGTTDWLKAPNGEATKLNERQWVQVRTPAFKSWFGDWATFAKQQGGVWSDGDGKVSKVVDANGEPLVVYHGADAGGFSEFNKPGGTARGDVGIFTSDNWNTAGSYVTRGRAKALKVGDVGESDNDVGEWWNDEGGANEETPFKDLTADQLTEARARYRDEIGRYADKTPGVYALFMNLRNPGEQDFEGAHWNGDMREVYNVILPTDEEPYTTKDGKRNFSQEEAMKLATELDGDIVPAQGPGTTTDDAVREARKYGHDGTMISEVVDDGPGATGFGDPSNVFVAFNPNQLKSADFSNGEYSLEKDDIRMSPARENIHGFIPELRDVVKGRNATPERPLFTQSSTNANAAQQISSIDQVLKKFPEPEASPAEWNRMMGYALASREVPIPPYKMLGRIEDGGYGPLLKSLSPGQVEEANHGFENAAAFKKLYEDGTADVTTTGKLALWSFLSRGVSPYVQESLFLDAVTGIEPWVQLAARGEFDEQALERYVQWAGPIAAAGSGQPGAGSKHNLNAFGRSYLFNMSKRHTNGKTRLQHWHDLVSDSKNTGPQLRRDFALFGEGVGIDNKVVSFSLLVSGRKDVVVLDRVQIKGLWDDGRFAGRNLYDGVKDKDGNAIASSSLANLFSGVRGLLTYEAIERALSRRMDGYFAQAGRPNDASLGRFHWETWVAYSGQEASHGTISGLMDDTAGKNLPYQGITAKEGEYGAFAYGSRYGIDATGTPYFLYNNSLGKTYQFSLPDFREMLEQVKKSANKVVPASFKVSKDANGNTRQSPWFNDPRVNRDRLDRLVEKLGSAQQGERSLSQDDSKSTADGSRLAIQRSPARKGEQSPGRTTAQQLSQPGGVRGSDGVLAGTRRPYQGDGRQGSSLEGLPARIEVDGKQVVFAGYKPAQDAAAAYMKDAGLEYSPPKTYAKVDAARAARIADAFEAMPDAPGDSQVKAAYKAMIQETLDQYQAILKTGLKVEFNDGSDPYGNPRNAILDAVENNHLFVFSTKDGFGSSELDVSKNPMLAETEFKFGDKPALANDIFRAVHDYFGHIKEGVGFRADGEENAWRSHTAMYSPLARQAMTTETRGQNSWVNYGPKAEFNRTANGGDTVYADQKVGLLPKWVTDEGSGDAPTQANNSSDLTQTSGIMPKQNVVRPEELIALRKRKSVLESILKCMG